MAISSKILSIYREPKAISMNKSSFSKIIIFALILVIFIISSGFSSPTHTLQRQNKNITNIVNVQNQITNRCYEEALKTIEINQLADSFYYITNSDNIDQVIDKYKTILIEKANEFLSMGEYVGVANLLNSRLKYYHTDDTITNLIKINNQYLVKDNQAEYDGYVEHLAFTTLIAYPDKAFDSRNPQSTSFDETKLTTLEFQNILQSLYNNNYILVNIGDCYQITNGRITIKQPLVPKNKKPIILSFDNVTYVSNYQNLGEIDKIIIDRNNNIATYTTKKSIQDRVQYDNEFVVILENFVSNHPDFSHNGARGIIFLSGENGILGYNTNHKNASSKIESKRVFQVIKKLKELGWKFGSNNYSYQMESELTEIEFAKQLNLWKKEIVTIIGDTNLYAHAHRISNKDKHNILTNNGFEIFFYNSDEAKITLEDNTLQMSRRKINGNALRNNSDQLSHLFDCEKVYDNTNRTVPYFAKELSNKHPVIDDD